MAQNNKLRFGWGFFRDLIDWSQATIDSFNGAPQIKSIFLQAPNFTSAVAKNTTGSVTAAQLLGKLITSTSAAAVSVTLPTATELATALGATRGTIFDFNVDNSAGANTVTVVVNTGIAVATPAITGGATLTVSTANKVGIFRLTFTSGTTAVLSRLV